MTGLSSAQIYNLKLCINGNKAFIKMFITKGPRIDLYGAPVSYSFQEFRQRKILTRCLLNRRVIFRHLEVSCQLCTGIKHNVPLTRLLYCLYGSLCCAMSTAVLGAIDEFHKSKFKIIVKHDYSVHRGITTGVPIWWCSLTSIGNLIVEIRQSYDCLISTMRFPLLVKWYLHIESRPCFRPCLGLFGSVAATNLALNQPTWQVNINNGRGHQLAVDGNVAADSYCATTQTIAHAWWAVDLVVSYRITHVILTLGSTSGNAICIIKTSSR